MIIEGEILVLMKIGAIIADISNRVHKGGA